MDVPLIDKPAAEQDLLAAALDDRALMVAWEHVQANDGCAGVDGQSINQFAKNALARLQQLKIECFYPAVNGAGRTWVFIAKC